MKDEMDILREMGSISAGHGSTALSEILGRRINLTIPNLDIVPTGMLLKKLTLDQIVVSVSSHMLSGMKGDIIFILDEKSAFQIIGMCYRIKPQDKKSGMLTEMGISVIKEVGIVVISSCLGALGMMLKTLIIPSVPTLVSGPIQQIVSAALSAHTREEYVLLMDLIFEEPLEKIKGNFYLILSPEAMKSIQETCKQILASLEQRNESH